MGPVMRPALRRAALSISAVLIVAAPAATFAAEFAEAESSTAAPEDAFEARIQAAKTEMMSDPQGALSEADGALALAGPGAAGDVRSATASWLRAEALTRMNRPSEALPVAEAALETARTRKPGSKLHGDLLMTVSTLRGVQGHAQEALAGFHQAHDIFRKLGEARSQAKALQSIGSIYNDARDFQRTLKYYDEAAAVYAGDPVMSLSAHNNRANALKEMGRYEEAEARYKLALADARKIDSPLLIVRILTNIASAQYLKGDLDLAERTARQALALAQGPAQEWRPYIWGVLAQIALKRGDPGRAEQYLRRTFQGQDLNRTTLMFRDFHLVARDVYEALGEPAMALAHLKAFVRLDDEARDASASVNSALMAARFDYNNQRLQISELKAERLAKDVQLSKTRQQFAVGAVAALALMLAIVLWAYFSVRRNRNAVRKVNAELTTTNVALERALAARSQLLATTSHEIRTPLNGILGMTEILLRDRALTDDVRNKLQVVKSSGVTLQALVDDILDVAKIETGEIKVWKAETDLRALLGEVGDLWSEVAREKGVAFNVELAECPATAITDARRLRQIVFNLVSNAVKFTDAGAIVVRASTAVAADGPRLRIAVVDTGPGVPESEQERVFEAFHQVDGQTTRKHGGTGLGLAICRDLARALGGVVTLESRVGEGATFTVDVPLEQPETVPAGAVAVGSADAAPVVLDILLVEPNPLTVSLIKAAFGDDARRLERVDSVAAAAETLAARPFDAVVAGPGAGADPVEWTALAEVRPETVFVRVADGEAAGAPFDHTLARGAVKTLPAMLRAEREQGTPRTRSTPASGRATFDSSVVSEAS